MGMVSSARYTHANFHLRAATEIVLAPTGNYWIKGECGHIMDCVSPRWVKDWEERIAAKRRHRRRCGNCPKDS